MDSIDDIDSVAATQAWANDIRSGADTIPPRVTDNPPNMLCCKSFVRDVSRALMLFALACQVAYFQYVMHFYVNANHSASYLTPLWIVTAVLTLAYLLLMVLQPRLLVYYCIAVFSYFWDVGTLKLAKPLQESSLFEFFSATNGDAFIVYYLAWLFYDIVYLTPRLWWLVIGTTPDVVGKLIPHSFLIFAFIVNMCLNLSYLYNTSSSSRQDPFEIVYEVLQSTKKAMLEVLDIMAVCNELGTLQRKIPPEEYLELAVPVLMVASVMLAGITLEVNLKATGFWTFGNLTAYQQSSSSETRRYSRSSILFFASFLIFQIVSDLVLLLFRLIGFLRGLLGLSSFIYKNLFYLLIHSIHIYSLLMVLPIYPESAFAASA